MLDKIDCWLKDHNDRLERFSSPVPLAELSQEIKETPDKIRTFFNSCKQPILYVWSHQHKGKMRACKPYCLRMSGGEHVYLDWENSLVGVAEAVFKQRGYECRREIGTDEHLAQLCKEPSFDALTSAVNQRDLWALRRSGNDNKTIDLYIVEAKGKQAGGFGLYCFAQVLSQVFRVRCELLKTMLGDKPAKAAYSHGYCWEFAQKLYDTWTELGYRPTITVGLLLPEGSPDVVWDNKKTRILHDTFFYAEAILAFRRFLEGEKLPLEFETQKGRSAFRQMFIELDEDVQIKRLANAKTGLRFRLLTIQNGELLGLED